jgi:uroporphyrinogen decarboxylase
MMTGKERIETALRREPPDVVPTFEWFIDESVGKALTGATDAIEIVEALDIDGINIRADYQADSTGPGKFADEWGATRLLTGDCIAAVVESPIKDIADHLDYQFPATDAPHRFRKLERALERFGDQRAIILNLRDGFSDMRDLLSYEEALVQFMLEPDLFAELLDRVVEYNLELARIAADRYGVSIVATTDDVANANGLLMRPEQYMEVIGPAFRKVMRGYKELGYTIIKHCDGEITSVIDFWIDCGIDCLDPIDPDAGYKMAEMKARYGDRICLKGNIDCKGTLCDGTPEEVAEEVRRCIADGGANGGLILSSSNTIHRGVKPENYAAMLAAMREYGRSQ